MAELGDTDREIVWATFMKDAAALIEAIGLTKAELRAAVDATDTWINNNQSSYNSALPSAAQSSLTAKQKTRLFLEVARRRYNVEA